VIFLSDEFDDDYNEFLERIKKFLNIDSDIFDVDFLFLPEPNFAPSTNPKNRSVKGFKVTYHFESGMDKPEIKIEGNFDEKKLQDYFKRLNISNFPQFKRLGQSDKKQSIEVGNLSLEPYLEQKKSLTKEPYYEINSHDEFADIVIEAPGIEKGHIILSLSFESTMEDHVLEVNNGIVSIIMRKKKT